MAASSWVCQCCGRVGGFILRGYGVIVCSGCDAMYTVLPNGQLLHIGHLKVSYG